MAETLERSGIDKGTQPQPSVLQELSTHGAAALFIPPPVMTSLPCITTLGNVFVTSQELMSRREIFTQLLGCGITPAMPFQEDHSAFEMRATETEKALAFLCV